LGGSISVESRQGQGAVFTVTLPCEPPAKEG
jgi:signal transduction histidine kinase